MPREDFNPPLPQNFSFAGSFGTQASIPNVYVTEVQSTVTIPELDDVILPETTDKIIIQRGNDTLSTELINVIDLVPNVVGLSAATAADLYAEALTNTEALTPQSIYSLGFYQVENTTQWLSTEERIVGIFSCHTGTVNNPGTSIFGFEYYSAGTFEGALHGVAGGWSTNSNWNLFTQLNFTLDSFTFRYYQDNTYNVFVLTAQPIANIAWNGANYYLQCYLMGNVSSLYNPGTQYIGTLFTTYPNTTVSRSITINTLITSNNKSTGLVLSTTTALTALDNDYYILNANGLIITLPDITSLPTYKYFNPITFLLKTGSAGTVNTFSGSQFINGSLTTYSLSATYQYVTLITDGAGWFITNSN